MVSEGEKCIHSDQNAIAFNVKAESGWERRAWAERWTGTSGVSCRVDGPEPSGALDQRRFSVRVFCNKLSFGSAVENAHRAVRPEAKFPQGVVVVLFLFD